VVGKLVIDGVTLCGVNDAVGVKEFVGEGVKVKEGVMVGDGVYVDVYVPVAGWNGVGDRVLVMVGVAVGVKVAVLVMVPVTINGVRLMVGVWIESVPVAVVPDISV